ncbi:hypothetical protein Bca101_033416 [Brassica carinata]
MDFHSLTRRDLQSLCKMNKIPANKTNLAMADAHTALEIVEGLEEYLNRSDSNVLQSPTSVAKLPPNTAARTTRRNTSVKAEPQPSSSQLVNRSCRLVSKKSLDGEMDQENVAQEAKTNNVKFEANVAKTPAARSTRKAPRATSYISKVLESKKGELVQSAYSTRRSTRLLEKCMADLSSPETTENSEVVPCRDLNLEIFVDLRDISVLDTNIETNKGDEVISDEKETEKSLVQVNKQEGTLEADKAISEEGSKQNDNDQEIGDTEIYIDLGDILVSEHANTETNNDNEESKNVQAFDSLVQVEHQETEDAIQDNIFETEKTNTFDEAMMNRTAGVSEAEPEEDNSGVDLDGTISEADSNQTDNRETEHATQVNDSETEKINTLDEDKMVDQTEGDSETEPEEGTEIYVDLGDNSVLENANSEIINDNKGQKSQSRSTVHEEDAMVDQSEGDSEAESEEDSSGVDSNDTISEADSNQADNQETEQTIQENDPETEKINTFDEETVVDQTDGDSKAEPEEDSSGVDSDGTISEADSNQADNQETEHKIQENDHELEKINTFDEEAVVDQTDGDSEAESEDDSSGVDSDGIIYEADSNQADNQETEHAIQENDHETEKINTFVIEAVVDQTDGDVEGDNSGVDSDVTISEADPNQAVHGSDIADAEMILSE